MSCPLFRGQSLIEFVLVLPVLLVLLLGIIEFGWLFKNILLVANASREGVRAAAVGKTTAEIQSRANNFLTPLTGTIMMEYSTDDGASWNSWPSDASGYNGVPNGGLIRITIETTNSQLTNFFPGLNDFPIEQFVVMKREPT